MAIQNRQKNSLSRSALAADFAERLGVEDAVFLDWQDAHLQQDWYPAYGLHVLCDTRWNRFAVYVQAPDQSCRLVHTNVPGAHGEEEE